MLSILMRLTNLIKNIIYFIDREGLLGNYCFVGNERLFFIKPSTAESSKGEPQREP